MTVAELIEILQDADGGAEVRLAMQPSYPMQHEVRGIVTEDRLYEDGLIDEEGDETGDNDEVSGIVWITDGGQVYDRPYLPGVVADAAW